jgi:drug/metabolite transporter (DMT)-like permease
LNEALALAAVAFVVVLSALTSRRRREVTPVVLVGTLLLITILLPMLTHFEERYLYPAKALALFLPYFIADSAHLGFRNWLSMRRSGRARD